MAAKHREFAGRADWALPLEEVAAIEATAATFEPSAPVDRRGWLFKEHLPDIPEIQRGDDFAAYNAALETARAEAAAEIAASTDWEGLFGFARSTELSWFLGTALAQAGVHEHELRLLSLLESDDVRSLNFSAGYFFQRFRDAGWDWLDAHLIGSDLSSEQAARLLLYTSEHPKAWEVAAAAGEDVASAYWKNFRITGLGADFQHVDHVAGRLLEVDRPGAALDLVRLYSREDEETTRERAELIVRGLEALLDRDRGDVEISYLAHDDVIALFECLERSEVPRQRLAQLEWAYLPAFGIDGRPMTLTRMLSEDPSFFVDFVRRIYRPRMDEDQEISEAAASAEDDERRAAIATNAYRLLSDWKIVPGSREDGTVDAEALEAWVLEAREHLRESGHLEAGDSRLGHVLAYCPADADGARPGIAARNLIEKLQSPELDDGLRVELYNSRGVTTRGPYDGGDQERAVAAGYFAQADRLSARWPRTAAILRDLGESYERDARRLDTEAERRLKGFDK